MALAFLRLLLVLSGLGVVGVLIYRATRRPVLRRTGASRGPYDTLGVSPDASPREITAAFRKLMNEYHPDKVAHLGAELRELAARKTREILDAYEFLRRKRAF